MSAHDWAVNTLVYALAVKQGETPPELADEDLLCRLLAARVSINNEIDNVRKRLELVRDNATAHENSSATTPSLGTPRSDSSAMLAATPDNSVARAKPLPRVHNRKAVSLLYSPLRRKKSSEVRRKKLASQKKFGSMDLTGHPGLPGAAGTSRSVSPHDRGRSMTIQGGGDSSAPDLLGMQGPASSSSETLPRTDSNRSMASKDGGGSDTDEDGEEEEAKVSFAISKDSDSDSGSDGVDDDEDDLNETDLLAAIDASGLNVEDDDD